MTKKKIIRIAALVAVWFFTLLMAFVFARAGWMKFSNTSGWARAFIHWGYPVWFRVLIGIGECAGAALLPVPRFAKYGAAIIVAIMLGGIWTHIRSGEIRHIGSEITPIVMATIVVLLRRYLDQTKTNARAAKAA